MKETTSKEKMLKKIRKALLEKRDNPYPNLEDTRFTKNITIIWIFFLPDN
jgi:hypothetical protein